VLFVHRWLGVALSAFFLLWFPTGIGMMYWDFPGVTDADRLERASSLDASAITLSARDAYATLGIAQRPTELRLNMFDGRPVYRFRAGGAESIVYADTGARQDRVSPDMMRRIASAWSGLGADAAVVEAMHGVDQWTVPETFRALEPLWKFSWPTGEQVYVSQSTGEVVQATTRAARIGAYLGPIPHWLYFTQLRKHPTLWRVTVIWTSGLAALGALSGIVVGLWTFSPGRRYRHRGVPATIPYRGAKRWHITLGLIFGVSAATWAFSGMLSMEPFAAASARTAEGTAEGSRGADGAAGIARLLDPRFSIAALPPKDAREALEQLAPLQVQELELTSVAGELAYKATLRRSGTRIVPMQGTPLTEVDRAQLFARVAHAAHPVSLAELRVLERYDRYYRDRRRHQPLPVILARLNDAPETRYYIDPRTARIVGTYSTREWETRWLYHGLHSLDFPWLYDHRPLWDIIVIALLIGGTALCCTSLVLAWRVVGRALARA
jgi:hypothetical protein